MKKILKWTGIVLFALVLVILASSWLLSRSFNSQFNKVYELTPAPVSIPTDSASIARGMALSGGCQTCHAKDLAGEVFFDDPKIGSLPSSNLTRAAGSETESYTDEDFVRAIRHGLNKQGNPLMIMPSDSYAHLSDEDLGSLIAYIKSLQPIERTFAGRKFTYMAQVMAGAGLFGEMFPYNKIDHDKAKNVTAPPVSNSLDYGKYVVNWDGCTNCHGANLGGGKSPDPVSPPVPDISKSGPSSEWTLEGFTNFFRTGTTPHGKVVDSKFMPYLGLGALTDVEIEAVYNYIHSLPPANPAPAQ
jgi:mono/diheme cytochrome c family protein